MRRFVAGAVFGAALVALGMALDEWMSDPQPELHPAQRDGGSEGAGPEPEGVPVLEGVVAASAGNAPARGAKPFEPGEIILSVGEGYVFEQDHALGEVDPASVDLYCQDIRHGASLYCTHGAGPALAPMTSVGLPARPVDAAKLVHDAPEELGARNLMLSLKTSSKNTGFGFVKAASGKTYEIVLLALEADPDVLKRSVRLQFEPVEVRVGGGELHLPSVAGTTPLPQSDRAAIRRAAALGRSVPGDSFARGMVGEYRELEDLLPDTRIEKRGHYYLRQPLEKWITLNGDGALWAAEGLAPNGVVALRRGGAFGTPGDLDGTLSNNGYSYIYVGGDLVGTVLVDSYATVVIEGDLRGELRVRSYTDLYLKGRILGTLDCKGSCWSTFYFEGYWSRADLENLGKGFGSVTLHVRQSDLPEGKSAKVGSWREVIVGAKSWERIEK